MGFCRACDHSAMDCTTGYNTRTMMVVVKYKCLICGHTETAPEWTVDKNDCWHPVYMTLGQWIERCRRWDRNYLALVPVP